MRLLLLVFTLFVALTVSAAKPNPKAPIGGNFTYNLESEPTMIHPVMSTDYVSTEVRVYLGDSLLYRDPMTYEWKPRLAEKWTISKDGKTYTFVLRKGLVFHDDHPITAEDVKFSFEMIFDPKYKAQHLIPYFEGIAKVEVIDPLTIKVTAKDSYFKNFDVMAGLLEVLPKHVYGDVDKSLKMTRSYVGAGPYMFEKWDKGQMITIKRFDKWFGFQLPEFKGFYNFNTITFRFYREETVVLERAKKGELDFITMRPESFAKKTEGDPWGRTILKKKPENSVPKTYGYIGWNLRKEIFQDRNTRLALAHLVNREEMNKKFNYELFDLAKGPLHNNSEYVPPHAKAIPYDPKKAAELLAEVGWKDADKNGVLERNIGGKKTEFRFKLMYANKETEKFWTMLKEDLKKAGIVMEMYYLEWNAFMKYLDEGNFDAVTLRWAGGDVDWDPKQIWHSSGAVPGGSNFIYYKNPEVDRLIDQARLIVDKERRKKLLQQVYEKIVADAPYAFLFNEKYDLYAVQKRIEQPAETFKYDLGLHYWWVAP